MIRHSFLTGVIAAAIVVAPMGPLSGASTSITGAVKITGLASSADVVVYVQQAPGTFPAPEKPPALDQQQMQFLPHVLPIVVGTTVTFLNSDPTQHNVFSPNNERYNLGTWPQGQSKDYTFSKCARTPCVYTQLCRLHPKMEGYIVVLQNPYFAVTDEEGHYEIANVPPGSYSVAVWHKKAKAQPKPVTVDASKPAAVDFVLVP